MSDKKLDQKIKQLEAHKKLVKECKKITDDMKRDPAVWMEAQIRACTKGFCTIILLLFALCANGQYTPDNGHMDFNTARIGTVVFGGVPQFEETERRPGYLEVNLDKGKIFLYYLKDGGTHKLVFLLRDIIIDPLDDTIYLIYKYHYDGGYHDCFVITNNYISHCARDKLKKDRYHITQYFIKADRS